MNACEKICVIQNKLGLHARPASMLVNCSNKFQSEIYITRDNETVNGKSIMGVMMLAAGKGTKLQIRAEGEDAQNAVDSIEQLINEKFGEE